MSDVKVVTYLLTHNSSLNAVVSTSNIMAGIIPQRAVLPAIAISHVSTIRHKHISAGSTYFCRSRVQVTVQASDYPTVKAIAALVRGALPRTRGSIGGVNVDSILHELDGPDWCDDDAKIYMQSLDYMITYNE